MKNSIIITYRNREEHLRILLPRLLDYFKNQDFEIIIAEQNDNNKFRKSCLQDLAITKYSNGDNLILHDIDYYPTDNVNYEIVDLPIYPIKNAIFIDNNLKEKNIDDIPYGYRNFKYDVGNHSGGVFCLTRQHFEKINGFDPRYIGWGFEDEDMRDRTLIAKIPYQRRKEGTFFILEHDDNIPNQNDLDYINNINLYNNLIKTRNYSYGYKNIDADIESFNLDGYKNILWLKINNFKIK